MSLHLKLSPGESAVLAERLADGTLRKLGEFKSAGKCSLEFTLPDEVIVERGRVRAARLASGARPSGLSHYASAKQAQHDAQATFYCHLYRDGVYLGVQESALDGRLTKSEAETAGRKWNRQQAGNTYQVTDQRTFEE